MRRSFDGKSYIDAGDVGDFDDDDEFTFSAWIYPTRATGAIVTKTRDESESRGYTLQLKDGKVQISVVYGWAFNGVRIETEKPLELGEWHHVSASYDGSREARGLTLIVDGVRQPSTVQVDVLNDPPSTREPLRIGGGGGPENRFQGLIDEVRIYDRVLTDDEVAVLFSTRPLNEIAQRPEAQRTAAEQAKVRGAFLESADAPEALRQASRRLSEASSKRDAYYDGITTVMVMQEMPTPRETHVLLRGAYDQFGETVAPDVPSILPPIPKDYPRNRLGLARWLVQPSNPLTARVAVNRYWQMYFGAGIVKTVEDFGSQGEPPSHPELLDWLATEFVRTGWNVKELQKLIVMSATYRQDSQASAAALQRDPENRLLARGPRFRLPAETVRDQALRIAGLLVEKVGGPSVKPYQPEGSMARSDAERVRGIRTGPWRKALSTKSVHLLEAHDPAADDGELRRPESRERGSPAQRDEHTAPGAQPPERCDLSRGRAASRRADASRRWLDACQSNRVRVPSRDRPAADGCRERDSRRCAAVCAGAVCRQA